VDHPGSWRCEFSASKLPNASGIFHQLARAEVDTARPR
jgi:hypothetical protein